MKIELKIDTEKLREDLNPLIDDIDALKGLSAYPEQAEKITDRIYSQLYKLIYIEK